MLTFFLYLYLRFVALTSRIRVVSSHPDSLLALREERPLVYVFWHQNIAFLLYYFGKRKTMILMSPEGKSDLLTKLSQWMGLKVSKISLEGGGRHALLNLIDELKARKLVLIPADGLRGPERLCKTSCFVVAQQGAAPLVPVTWKSWNPIRWKMKNGTLFLPLPFSSIEIRLGSAMSISPHQRLEQAEGLKVQLAEALDQLDLSH